MSCPDCSRRRRRADNDANRARMAIRLSIATTLFLCDWRWRSSYFVRSLALRAHSVLSLSWHGVQWRTFRPRGIWREPTLWPKMAAGAPQRPPLTSWRSFPEGARWRPCRIFVGVDCVVRRSTRALCTCTDISVSIYIHT